MILFVITMLRYYDVRVIRDDASEDGIRCAAAE